MRLLILELLKCLSISSSLSVCPSIVKLLLKKDFITFSLSKVNEVPLLPAFDNVLVVELVLENSLFEEVELSCPVIRFVVCELRQRLPVLENLGSDIATTWLIECPGSDLGCCVDHECVVAFVTRFEWLTILLERAHLLLFRLV